MTNIKIGIYGFGAITLTIARALEKNQIPFIIIARNLIRKEEIQNQKFKFSYAKEKTEDFEFQNRAQSIDEIKDKFDFIFIGSKTQELENSVFKALPLLSPLGKMILIQNGIPENKLDIPKERMIGGVVGWNTQKLPDGTYFQSNSGFLILGEVNGTSPNVILKQLLSPFIPTILTNNLTGYRWQKLGINCVINGLAGSCLYSLGELLLNTVGRRVSLKLLNEIRSLMEKYEIKEEVVPGSIAVSKLADGQRSLPLFLRHIILIFLGLKYYKIRTSMVQDLDHGRETEIDHLNGIVVEMGKKVGLPTPINEKICNQIHALEKRRGMKDYEFLRSLL